MAWIEPIQPISEPLNMSDDLYARAYCGQCEHRDLTDSERSALATLLRSDARENHHEAK